MREKFKQAGIAAVAAAVLFCGAWLMLGREQSAGGAFWGSGQAASGEVSSGESSKTSEELIGLVFSKYNAGDFKGALKTMDLYIKKTKDSASGYYFKGGLLYQMKKYKESVKYMDKALKIDPALSEAYSAKGFAFVQLKKYKEAETALNAALEIKKEEPSAFYALAGICIMTGRYEQALAYLEKYLPYGAIILSEDCESWIAALDKEVNNESAQKVKSFIEEKLNVVTPPSPVS